MKKVRFVLAACLLVLLLLVSACGDKSRTVMLNQSSSLYYKGITMEATVRELTIDGKDASVRIRFLNRSSDSMGMVGAKVAFLDETGATLYTDELMAVCEYPIPSGDSIALTAKCSGKNVKNIASVQVSQLDG